MSDNARAILLMIVCTLFLTAAQYGEKLGAEALAPTVEGLLHNVPLILGIISAAIGAVLLTYALKFGDLSLVFPFVALSFIWTGIVAWLVFKETMTPTTIIGMFCIIIGVSVLGISSRQKQQPTKQKTGKGVSA